jgi:hypothetical protein
MLLETPSPDSHDITEQGQSVAEAAEHPRPVVFDPGQAFDSSAVEGESVVARSLSSRGLLECLPTIS